MPDPNGNCRGTVVFLMMITILVLIICIHRQAYSRNCRKVYENHYKTYLYPPSVGSAPLMDVPASARPAVSPEDTKSGFEADPPEKHRIVKTNPEKRIMDYISLGKPIQDMLQMKADPLTLDQLPVESKETSKGKLVRSLTDGSVDGPQMEGMKAPIETFEKSAMLMQNAKQKYVYGDHYPDVNTDSDAMLSKIAY